MSARWYQNSPQTWLLKEPIKFGGAVLATIEQDSPRAYFWRAGSYSGGHWSQYGAQRAVRRALREQESGNV